MSFSPLSRVIAPLVAAFFAFAQPAVADVLDRVDEDDQEALEALAVYPEETRDQALEVATEAGKLVELQKLQDDSRATFKDLLAPYSQDEQEQLFELSRYPDLVESIASGGPKSRGDLARIAAEYPEDVRTAAVAQGAERHKVVSRMHALLEDFDHRFDELIEDLSPRKQQAFRGMLGTPELLSLLAEHTAMTVLLGDAYDRNPDDVRQEIADLNIQVARRNAEEADDWKQTVDSDPDLRRDYDAAANDYRSDTGYDAYSAPSRTVVNVHVNPYPYWVGYPWWYPVSYTYYDPGYWWYPRHSWGGYGYSYGPRVVLYGGPVYRPWYPSYHFTSWYFSHGGHHSRYPYLSDRFVSYYDRPVVINNNYYFYNARNRVVRKFHHENDRVFPGGYFKGNNRRDRVERFREYGKIAPDLEKVRRERRHKEFAGKGGKRPGRDFRLREDAADDKVARDEVQKLVKKNPKQFPELAKVKKEDWDKPVAREGRGGKKRAGDDTPAFDSDVQGKKAKGGKRGDDTLTLDQSDEGQKKGRKRGDETLTLDQTDEKGRKKGSKHGQGAASPAFDGGPEKKGKKNDEPRVREREKVKAKHSDQPAFDAGDRKGKKSRDAEKVRPNLALPSDGEGGGGGGGGNRKAKTKAKSFDASPNDGGGQDGGGGGGGKRKKAASPSYDAPSAGDGGGGGKRKKAASPSYDAPSAGNGGGGGGGGKKRNVEQPSYEMKKEAPKREREQRYQQQSEPAPRIHQGGGGGGGNRNRDNDDAENRKQKQKEEEEAAAGGGGGGGGGGKRNKKH